MTPERETNRLTALGIPTSDGMVPATRDDMASIMRESDGDNCTPMTPELRAEGLTSSGIPHPNGLVVSTRENAGSDEMAIDLTYPV